jgi:Flp pilus assembly protein TadG
MLKRVRREDERGQAMVEFALVAPVFFLILFAIIQLGLMFAAQNGVVSAVRETARYAAPYRVADSSGASDTCTFYVLGKLGTALQQSVPAFSGTGSRETIKYASAQGKDTSTTGANTPWYITITVHEDYDLPVWVPLVGNFIDGLDGSIDGKITLHAQEQMRVENDGFASDPFGGTTTTCTSP